MSSARLSTAVTGYLTALKSKIMRASGPAFHGLFLDNDEGEFSFVAEPLVSRKVIVNNADDLGFAKATLQSNEYVFNSWQRISRGNWRDGQYNDPTLEELQFSDNALPAERDAFTYDATSDLITNSLDTKSMVGFVSPEAFDTYVLDVALKSNSPNQNDPIGLLIGYVRDSDGTTHTLTVFRNLRAGFGMDKAMEVMVDFNTVGQVPITDTSTDLLWSDGTAATTASPGWSGNDAGHGMWNDVYPNGVRLRVTRSGDDFTLETSNLGESTLVPGATITFNLSDDPSLERFKGPSPYGFVSISQDNAIWEANQRPGNAPTVYDVRTSTKHEWNGTSWTTESFDMDEEVKKGRLYFNDSNGKVFYRTQGGVVEQLLTT